MIDFTEDQLTMILALYVFKHKKLDTKFLNTFTSRFNKYYDTDINVHTIINVLSIFKKIDPRENVNKEKPFDTVYYSLCNKYIESDKLKELKNKFNIFNDGVQQGNDLETEIDEINIETFNKSIDKYKFSFIDDMPKELYKGISVSVRFKRSANVVYNALAIANFKCEFSDLHKSFIRKKSNIAYTEAHHLIPLKYQKNFDVNLDVEANVVSLCSDCHNKIHYGKDWQEIITFLYNSRINRLKKSGINLSLADVLKMYDGVKNG
ncbi:MAG: HNH endonuclease [Prevotella sp.]|nr:HNH endonuclease [Prevotella sp.]